MNRFKRSALLVMFFSAIAIGAVSAPTAFAAAPSAVTERPTNVHLGYAELHGTVNPQGHATKYRFEYTNSEKSYLTPEVNVGEGTTPVPVSALLSELKAGVQYHVHLIAKSSEGTSNGATLSFWAKAPEISAEEGYPREITSSAGTTTLKSEGFVVTCKHQVGKGTLANELEVTLTLKLTECTWEGSVKCGNVEAGVIETKELKGFINYTYPIKISGARETGLVFSPASGETIAEFSCGGSLFHLVATGSYIGVVTPLDEWTKNLALTFSASGFTQAPSEFETEGGAQASATAYLSVNGAKAKSLAVESASSLAMFGRVEVLAY